MLTIMASLAQQESQSLSQNIKMGLQYRYQQGKVPINHKRFLGYTKGADGNLAIEPEQAEIVKRIYREYLEGASMDKIATGLEKDGILTGAGGAKWHTSTIKKILTNEKYMGDALLQKTYTVDFLSKSESRITALCHNIISKITTPPLFRKTCICLCKRNLFVDVWSILAQAVKSTAIVVITAFRRLCFVVNVVRCIVESTGTIVAVSLLFGGASAVWNTLNTSVILAQ
ncbi:hypothetical protein M2140_001607 [Clostridiales Family XIII bacterium PM5-7]